MFPKYSLGKFTVLSALQVSTSPKPVDSEAEDSDYVPETDQESEGDSEGEASDVLEGMCTQKMFTFPFLFLMSIKL